MQEQKSGMKDRLKTIVLNYKDELITAVVFIVLALLFNSYRILGDASYYQAFSRLLITRFHNFNIGNQLVFQGQNLQQYGTSLFYLLFLLFAEMMLKFGILSFGGIPVQNLFVTAATNFYACIALVLLVRVLKKLELPVFSLYLMFFAAPAFLYSFPIVGHSHTIDIFLFSLIVYIFVLHSGHPFLLGVLTAISIYVRYVNLIVFVSFLIYFIFTNKKQTLYYLGGVICLLWFLPISLWIFNGSLFGTAAKIADPAAYESVLERFPPLPVHAFKLLVHPLHGLFIWSPLALLSFNGLILYFKERRDLSLLFLAWFLGMVWLYGYFYYWHAGWSFSQRYLIGLFPVYVIGYAYFVKVFPRLGKGLGIIFTLYSLFLFLNWGTVIHGSEGIPQDAITAWQKKQININHYFQRIESNWNIRR